MHLLVKQHEVQEVFLIVAFCSRQAAALVTSPIDYTLKNSLHISKGFVSLKQWHVPACVMSDSRRIVKLVSKFQNRRLLTQVP